MAAVAELRLHAPPRRLVAELQRPTPQLQQDVYTSVAIGDAGRADVSDPSLDAGLIAAAELLVIALRV